MQGGWPQEPVTQGAGLGDHLGLADSQQGTQIWAGPPGGRPLSPAHCYPNMAQATVVGVFVTQHYGGDLEIDS